MAKLTDEQKRQRGTAQPCRLSGVAPAQVVAKVPAVGLRGTAKKIFSLTATQLINQQILEAVNVDLLVAYSREMALYHDMTKELEVEGYTVNVTTKFGVTKQVNPKRKIAENALTNAKSLAAEFGFTPISRTRLSGLLAPKKNVDEFAEFEEIR